MRLPMVSIIDNPKSNYFLISTSGLKDKKKLGGATLWCTGERSLASCTS